MAVPQSTMALSRLFKEQKQVKLRIRGTVLVQFSDNTQNSSLSPWGSVGPQLFSSQLGLQTSAPCPELLSVPYFCRAASRKPAENTAASVGEATGLCGESEVWAVGEGVLQVVAAAEAAAAEPLQTEGCCWTLLWSRLHPNLDVQTRNKNKQTDVKVNTLLSDRLTG